jgi:hypothetical protein
MWIAFVWSLTQMQMLADIGSTDRAPPRASAANDNDSPTLFPGSSQRYRF